jgi:hypothetical protein
MSITHNSDQIRILRCEALESGLSGCFVKRWLKSSVSEFELESESESVSLSVSVRGQNKPLIRPWIRHEKRPERELFRMTVFPLMHVCSCKTIYPH